MSVRPRLLDLLDVLVVLDGVGVDLSVVSSGGSTVNLLPQCRQVAGDDIRGATVVRGASLV